MKLDAFPGLFEWKSFTRFPRGIFFLQILYTNELHFYPRMSFIELYIVYKFSIYHIVSQNCTLQKTIHIRVYYKSFVIFLCCNYVLYFNTLSSIVFVSTYFVVFPLVSCLDILTVITNPSWNNQMKRFHGLFNSMSEINCHGKHFWSNGIPLNAFIYKTNTFVTVT